MEANINKETPEIKFLREFKRESSQSEGESNQFRSPIVANIKLTPAEAEEEVRDWVLAYLEQRKCPNTLAHNLAKAVSQEICKSIDMAKFNNNGNTYIDDIERLHTDTITQLHNLCENSSPEQLLVSEGVAARFITSVCAVKNGRRKMEDRHVILHDLNVNCNLPEGIPKNSYYAVFDGHAGVEAASFAAAHLHHNIATHADFFIDPIKAIKEGFLSTDNQLMDKLQRSDPPVKSGCTALCAIIREDMLYIAWLGDSQAMLVRKGAPIIVMSPHKPDRYDEKKRIEENGGLVTFYGTWRVNGILAVSRAFGDLEYKPLVIGEPDIIDITLEGNEDFLVLACDGLWDRMTMQDVVATVLGHLAGEGSPETVSEVLVQSARDNGSSDNITAIVVFLRDPAEIAKQASNANSVPFPQFHNGAPGTNGEAKWDGLAQVCDSAAALEKKLNHLNTEGGDEDKSNLIASPDDATMAIADAGDSNGVDINNLQQPNPLASISSASESLPFSELPTPPIDELPNCKFGIDQKFLPSSEQNVIDSPLFENKALEKNYENENHFIQKDTPTSDSLSQIHSEEAREETSQESKDVEHLAHQEQEAKAGEEEESSKRNKMVSELANDIVDHTIGLNSFQVEQQDNTSNVYIEKAFEGEFEIKESLLPDSCTKNEIDSLPAGDFLNEPSFIPQQKEEAQKETKESEHLPCIEKNESIPSDVDFFPKVDVIMPPVQIDIIEQQYHTEDDANIFLSSGTIPNYSSFAENEYPTMVPNNPFRTSISEQTLAFEILPSPQPFSGNTAPEPEKENLLDETSAIEGKDNIAISNPFGTLESRDEERKAIEQTFNPFSSDAQQSLKAESTSELPEQSSPEHCSLLGQQSNEIESLVTIDLTQDNAQALESELVKEDQPATGDEIQVSLSEPHSHLIDKASLPDEADSLRTIDAVFTSQVDGEPFSIDKDSKNEDKAIDDVQAISPELGELKEKDISSDADKSSTFLDEAETMGDQAQSSLSELTNEFLDEGKIQDGVKISETEESSLIMEGDQVQAPLGEENVQNIDEISETKEVFPSMNDASLVLGNATIDDNHMVQVNLEDNLSNAALSNEGLLEPEAISATKLIDDFISKPQVLSESENKEHSVIVQEQIGQLPPTLLSLDIEGNLMLSNDQSMSLTQFDESTSAESMPSEIADFSEKFIENVEPLYGKDSKDPDATPLVTSPLIEHEAEAIIKEALSPEKDLEQITPDKKRPLSLGMEAFDSQPLVEESNTAVAPPVQIPEGMPEAEGVTEDSDSEKDGGWKYVKCENIEKPTTDMPMKPPEVTEKKIEDKKPVKSPKTSSVASNISVNKSLSTKDTPQNKLKAKVEGNKTLEKEKLSATKAKATERPKPSTLASRKSLETKPLLKPTCTSTRPLSSKTQTSTASQKTAFTKSTAPTKPSAMQPQASSTPLQRKVGPTAKPPPVPLAAAKKFEPLAPPKPSLAKTTLDSRAKPALTKPSTTTTSKQLPSRPPATTKTSTMLKPQLPSKAPTEAKPSMAAKLPAASKSLSISKPPTKAKSTTLRPSQPKPQGSVADPATKTPAASKPLSSKPLPTPPSKSGPTPRPTAATSSRNAPKPAAKPTGTATSSVPPFKTTSSKPAPTRGSGKDLPLSKRPPTTASKGTNKGEAKPVTRPVKQNVVPSPAAVGDVGPLDPSTASPAPIEKARNDELILSEEPQSAPDAHSSGETQPQSEGDLTTTDPTPEEIDIQEKNI